MLRSKNDSFLSLKLFGLYIRNQSYNKDFLTNLHLTKRHLKQLSNVEYAKNVQSSNVVECELCHIPTDDKSRPRTKNNDAGHSHSQHTNDTVIHEAQQYFSSPHGSCRRRRSIRRLTWPDTVPLHELGDLIWNLGKHLLGKVSLAHCQVTAITTTDEVTEWDELQPQLITWYVL